MNHLSYDAFNGSLVEQDLIYVIGNEEPPCEAIKHMAIGDIRPREDEVTNVVVSQAADEQAFADVPNSEGEQTPAGVQQGSIGAPRSGNAAPSLEVAASPTPIRG
jgi:hypothetical protein